MGAPEGRKIPCRYRHNVRGADQEQRNGAERQHQAQEERETVEIEEFEYDAGDEQPARTQTGPTPKEQGPFLAMTTRGHRPPPQENQ